MQEMYKFILGSILLILGIPIGNILARVTKEELRSGNKYFKIVIFTSLSLAILFLIFRKDDLFFTMLFLAIVTSRSLNKK